MILRDLFEPKNDLKLQINIESVNQISQYDLIVFSHLRWEFVTQRPQHIIKRLAKDKKVLFVEEPIEFTDESIGTTNIINPGANITVLQPRISWDNMIEDLTPIVKQYVNNQDDPILWFYGPSFVDIIDNLKHTLVVYDCMDQLTAFKGASAELINQEKRLLAQADIVFTGGKSLYEEKRKYHNNVHCFPSSVDSKHFRKALDHTLPIPLDLTKVHKPIVGFYGVVDERFDIQLLKEIAERMPLVSFVVIGPVVKISPEELPQLNNISYMGARDYEQLPNYLKAIDIAMMPFALNKSTQFISPTKTLEYMAAYKPIISTPIYDVVRDYKNRVSIVNNVDEFEKAIQYYLSETSVKRYQREMGFQRILNKTSWNITVKSMSNLMEDLIKNKDNLKNKKDMVQVFNMEPNIQTT